VADRVGTDLPGEIDFKPRVDRHHLVEFPDEIRIVRAIAGVKLDERVVIDEVVEPAAADHEARDRSARMDRLARVRHRPRLDQPHDAVGEHLGVDAEIVPLLEPGEHSVGDPANAELQAGAIFNERGDVRPDSILDVAWRQEVVARQVAVGRRPGRHPVEWHGSVAVGPGHALVDLSEDDSRRIDSRPRRVDARAE